MNFKNRAGSRPVFIEKTCYTIAMSSKNTNKTQRHFVYMLECSDGSLYTGWTTDLDVRVNTHNSGKGAKYTRSRLPVKLVYYEEFDDKLTAQSREREIKKMSRTAKLKLVNQLS
jgi:putative endonuclease